MAKEYFWVIRDERTETLIGKHSEKEFRDYDEVFQRYCHLPDAFTIYLEKQ